MAAAATVAFAVCSCNALDFDQSVGYESVDEVYATWDRAQQSLTHVYGYLEGDFGTISSASRACATDDAHYVWSTSSIHVFNDNRWSAINTVDAQWGGYFTAIRDANSFIKNFGNATFDRYQYDDNYAEWIAKSKYWIAEARFLRAYFHFELARRYGDIPLVKDNIYTVDNVNSVEKSSFAEVVAYIASECDEIAQVLPESYAAVTGAQTGRITAGAAKALKARALLYAASTTYNPTASKTDWEDAASASNDVIELGAYSLHTTLFPFSSGSDIITSPELILERRMGESITMESRNTSVSFEGGNTGTCPTQNLVDAFESKAGFDITFNEATSKWESNDPAFAENTPFANRDARFAETILCDGDLWKDVAMECYEGGKDGSPIVGASETGYYLKKYMNSSVELAPVSKATLHTWVLFRYAEVLLNYAEAMNEAYGPDDAHSYSLTALQALNQIRARAGQPERTTNDQDELRKMIRRERRVELAFENQRFWDIRRWDIGAQTTAIKGIKITKAADSGLKSYSIKSVENRTWETKKNLYPIPKDETYMNPNLTQNTDW